MKGEGEEGRVAGRRIGLESERKGEKEGVVGPVSEGYLANSPHAPTLLEVKSDHTPQIDVTGIPDRIHGIEYIPKQKDPSRRPGV